MLTIVHLAHLLKRPTWPCSTRACVPRVAARPKRKGGAHKRKGATTPKRKSATPSKPKRVKRKPPAKRVKRKPPAKAVDPNRSAASKKGWDKRRKKQRLIKAMHDAQWRQVDDQPIGWTQRRAELREINGEIWREIAVEYSEDDYHAKYLASLEELEIDLLTRDELYDYLEWIASESDIDISDLYRMYLGYRDKD
jgi:hypothetical protein